MCLGHALHSITNHKLPAAYEAFSVLRFNSERLGLSVGAVEQVLKPLHGRKGLVRSLVREGRVLAESEPMDWEPVEGIRVSRRIFVTHSDPSYVRTLIRFRITNAGDVRRLFTFRWELGLPRGLAFVYRPESGEVSPLPPGDIPRDARQNSELGFSFDSRRFDASNNRLLFIECAGLPRPYRVNLGDEGEDGRQVTAWFASELAPGEVRDVVIRVDFLVLLQQTVSNTVFLAARNNAEGNIAWPGALAASASWVDRLETCRETTLNGRGYRRFAPFLWFDHGKPLSDQALRFIHNMPCLERLVVLGEVLPHDLENLLTALLDKGGDRPLRLQIFTGDEYYRDGVNVLRGNIQARMMIADEPAQRVRQLEEIVRISVVENPHLLPLALREFMDEMSRGDYLASAVQDTNVFLVTRGASGSDQRRGAGRLPGEALIAAACVPMARHLGAPVLLWGKETEGQILKFLAGRNVLRLFIVGSIRSDEEAAIQAALAHGPRKPGTPDAAIIHIPYQNSVRAAAALSLLFRAHRLLDWLVEALHAERAQLGAADDDKLKRLAASYVESIAEHPWAKNNVAPTLREVIEGGHGSRLAGAYQDIFIGREEFIRSFTNYFIDAAEADQSLLGPLYPVWNDLAVLSDFKSEESEHVFSAACFAAYHSAPLLFFPAVSTKKQDFLDARVRNFEEQYFHLPTRDMRVAKGDADPDPETTSHELTREGVLDLFAHAEDLASIIFPPDVQTALETLRPLTVALYNSDEKVPYEAIKGRNGPFSLNFAMGRLSGTNAFETSIITSSGMLFAHELQRQEKFKVLLCMSHVPTLAPLKLGEEVEVIQRALEEEHPPKLFETETLYDSGGVNKEALLDKLAGNVHIFHFSGHGHENVMQPQRSGLIFWNHAAAHFTSLNALEINYRAKLGAHPVVFLNTCFGSSRSRINLQEHLNEDADTAQTDDGDESAESNTKGRSEPSLTSQTTKQIMGVSSSFINIGASAVMAPLWEIYDELSIAFAQYWYRYIARGCSIGEAALLAKFDSIVDLLTQHGNRYHPALGSRAISYVIYGDPTLRLFPARHLIENHPNTARLLLSIKQRARQ